MRETARNYHSNLKEDLHHMIYDLELLEHESNRKLDRYNDAKENIEIVSWNKENEERHEKALARVKRVIAEEEERNVRLKQGVKEMQEVCDKYYYYISLD